MNPRVTPSKASLSLKREVAKPNLCSERLDVLLLPYLALFAPICPLAGSKTGDCAFGSIVIV